MTPSGDPRLQREMSITPSEFFRTLRGYLDPSVVEVDGLHARVRHGEGTVKIELSNVGERKLGSLVLPRVDVEFRFTDCGPDQIDAFLREFETRFRRGGG